MQTNCKCWCLLMRYLRMRCSSMVQEGNISFNDALNTFYLWLYGVGHMVKDHLDNERGNPLPPHGNVYLTTHSTNFIYGYMTSDIWLRTILIVRKETRCCHIGYSFRLTARVLLYAPSQMRYHIPRPLLHQSWSTGWNEK